MAARGAFLAPALVPAASSFVCLPRAFVQTFLGGPDVLAGGAVILELSWETVDGYVQRVCAGWVGGLVKDPMRSDVIEIPAELARFMGIKDHLERMPHAFIAVHIVDSLPIARQVNVEPCTPDDWELIQLHAGSIEVELLRQMCVVNDNQVSPIWINHNTVIRVRAALPLGMEHARLTHLSEVIVAPKERQAQDADKHLSSDLFYEASPELFVQGNNQSTCQNDSIDEVWVHPQMLAMLDGAILPGAPLEIETTAVVVIWSSSSLVNVDSNLTADSDVPSSTASGKPKCVARLKCSEAVGRDKVMLNDAMCLRLELKRGSTVQLRVLRLPELPVARITLRAHCFRGDSTELDEIRQRFLELTSRSHHAIAINSGTILRISSVDSSNQAAHVAVDIEYAPGSSIDEALLEDVPTGALEKYTLLGAGSTVVLSPEQIRVEQASGAILQTLSTLRANQEQVADIYEESMLQVARSAKAYKELKKSVRTLLYSNAAACRVVLGTKPTGCAFLYGDRGSGKSTLLRSLSQELEGSRACGAHSVITDCRNLRGIKMESVKARLTELFDEAFAHAPSVIVLDNLDALVPEEEETAGPANDQSRRIAELLVVLMSRANDKMWKTTLELNLSYKREWEILGDTQLEARAELLKSIGAAMQRRSVAVIAAARSDSSIHKSLRNCGLFDHPIQVLSPDAERRETLIREMLSMKATGINNGLKPSASIRETVAIDPAVDFSYLASLTEGYSIRDLSSATDRTLHQTLKRYTLFESSRESLDEPRKIQQVDFVEALKDFQPTALIGVDLFKSSVKWSDVGGLGTVRTMLKDTLELPTRYGKLYENTPIKLPAGMLLYGPPGCGKTLLASAVANECGLNFISVKGPEVLNKYIGASEQAIRDLFARAASAAPSVLFLDEFDSIAPRRGADNTGVTDRLVNQLLTFLDGVEGRKGVYVLAATSRPDMIDPALLRPGRLDKSLYCGFPNEEERLDILRAVGKDMQLSEDAREYLPTIAAHPKSRHFSGADLQAVMYSAQLELVHEKLKNADSNEITKHHLEVAFESAKPSTSENARMQFDRMYAAFAKARNTDFAVADADASASSDDLKAHIAHQRTALA